MAVAGIPAGTPHLKSGRVRVIGVTTAKRLPHGPDRPSAEDAGLCGVDAPIWVRLFTPEGVPRAIVGKIYTEVAITLKAPEVHERCAALGGAYPIGTPPAEFRARVKRDLEIHRKVAQQVGLNVQ